MTPVPCSRLWEAEALEEGRLSGSDRASFDRHSASCAPCRAEREAFAALRNTLDARPAPTTTPLARQRARAQLLQRANTSALRPSLSLRIGDRLERARLGRAPIVAAVAALFLLGSAASAFVTLDARARHPSPNVTEAIGPSPSTPPLAAAAPPRFDARSSDEAVWLPRTEGSTTTVTLTRGTVSFTVPHLEPLQRFFVTLPDGEVEVRGTRFTVAVDADFHATTRIQVTEGHALLRMKGEPDGTLFAGEVWVPPDNPTAALPAASTTPLALQRARAAAHAQSARSTALPASTPHAGALFDAAVASFESGTYNRADAELADFARDYPNDPRAEDAAYLRAVSRWHLGDRPAAQKLARAYLDAYPAGLRRPEAERIVDAAPKAR